MKKILFLSIILLAFVIGCKPTEPVRNDSQTGVATSNQKSKFIIKFENVNVDDHFDHSRLWAEDFEGNVVKEEIEADVPRPIKNVYQRDFDGDGHDDLLIATEPHKNGLFFDFGVFIVDNNFNIEELTNEMEEDFQQEQQEQEQQQQEQQQQEQQNEDQMDKETAEQILQALEQDEQDTQEKMQRQQGKKRRVEKEW